MTPRDDARPPEPACGPPTPRETLMVPDLVKTTELFMIPSSFLVAALGTADTDLHKAGVSMLGLVVSVLWQRCNHEAFVELQTERPELLGKSRVRILRMFPHIFIWGWAVSVVGHAVLAAKWVVIFEPK